MILKAILCDQHSCSFGAILFIVNLLIKTNSTVICVPCILENVCCEPFSLKNCRYGRMLIVKWGDYHLSGEFTGPTFSSSLFGVDFKSGC